MRHTTVISSMAEHPTGTPHDQLGSYQQRGDLLPANGVFICDKANKRLLGETQCCVQTNMAPIGVIVHYMTYAFCYTILHWTGLGFFLFMKEVLRFIGD